MQEEEKHVLLQIRFLVVKYMENGLYYFFSYGPNSGFIYASEEFWGSSIYQIYNLKIQTVQERN